MKTFKVLASHLRPANKKQCFYCRAYLGTDHKTDCVIITKTVKVRAIVEYMITVPNCWSKKDIESHRNGGSWCADNMLTELNQVITDDECLCNAVTYEVVDMPEGD